MTKSKGVDPEDPTPKPDPEPEPSKTNVAEADAQRGLVTFAVAGYTVCSSLMLVVNKVAVHTLPSPAFVLFAQLFTSAAAVWLAGAFGWVMVDKLEFKKALAFMPVAAAFLGAIFTNIKTLQYANVETFIVFRSSTPILVSIADYVFLGRELPNRKSWLSLLGLLLGAVLYVVTDDGFQVHGYFWVCVWYFVFCFDQIYIKHAVDSVKMESNWGRVYYTNLLACVPILAHTAYSREDIPTPDAFTSGAMAALALSCGLGVGMSYFAFLARKLVSAASFTVIGNCCKIGTVLINLLIWDNHANSIGLACLTFCLGCSYFYQQAPMRKDAPKIGGRN